MQAKIEHPKVFISYAWGTREYQEKVLALASDLRADGIDVLFDKWDLKEGHDTYAFMESCVNDPSVTNVLILLDPVYAKKANDRIGGVGTETQIISPEIYDNVKQEKFLPVILEKDDAGNVPMPHYLKSRLYFNLSESESYSDEYQRLVKRLYGIEVYAKPSLGNMPKWVTQEQKIPSAKLTALQSLKKNSAEVSRTELVSLIDDLSSRIFEQNYDNENLLQQYDAMLTLRDEYLETLKYSSYIADSEKIIGDCLQDLYSGIYEIQSRKPQEIKRVVLHEIFIYTVAYYYKVKNYKALAYILNRTYFGIQVYSGYQDNSLNIFYYYCQALENEKCAADNKKYLSGTAQVWMDNIALECCSKKQFIFADVLICNYSLYGSNYSNRYPWFPLTYIYDGEYSTILHDIALRLKSREVAEVWMQIFGYSDLQIFKNKIAEVGLALSKGEMERIRYHRSFESASTISQFINSDEIATLN